MKSGEDVMPAGTSLPVSLRRRIGYIPHPT